MPGLQGAHGIPFVSFAPGPQTDIPNLPVVHATQPFVLGYQGPAWTSVQRV